LLRGAYVVLISLMLAWGRVQYSLSFALLWYWYALLKLNAVSDLIVGDMLR